MGLKLYVINVVAIQGMKARTFTDVVACRSYEEALGIAYSRAAEKFGEQGKCGARWNPCAFQVDDRLVVRRFNAILDERGAGGVAELQRSGREDAPADVSRELTVLAAEADREEGDWQ